MLDNRPARQNGLEKKVIADRYRGSLLRSCGTDPILSTQRIPRGRDQVGAILMKLVVFLKENVSRLNNLIIFKNRHSLFENRSLIDFEIGN